MYFYDKNSNGFYVEGINAIPESAIQIEETTYRLLLAGQSQGKQIIANAQGEPILIEPAPTEYHHLNNGKWEISPTEQQKWLAQQKAQLIAKLATQTDKLKSQILAGYPQSEIDSFYVQEREAREWQVDNNAPTPMLSAIAQNRGVPLATLIEKVIEKADQLAGIMGAILGQKQAFEDRLQAVGNPQKIAEIAKEIEQWQLSI